MKKINTKKNAIVFCSVCLLSSQAMAADSIRFATFNASISNFNADDQTERLSSATNTQLKGVAEVIQRVRPDVLLINEFDYDAQDPALFQKNYLSVGQNGQSGIEYNHVFIAPSNTGVPSGFDLDNDGNTGGDLMSFDYADDAYGFGRYPGQFGMVVLSKYAIKSDHARTFQNFLWKDMPGAKLPADPQDRDGNGDTANWYTSAELDAVRLSSKNHMSVPIDVNGQTIHFVTSHPTPPVFDGAEDRNGLRNHDEIRLVADFVDPDQNYMTDDNGVQGGLNEGDYFVIAGDLNADVDEGDSTDNPIDAFLANNPLINNSVVPEGEGGPDADDTAEFVGGVRVDYVLPSANLDITSAGVFWPEDSSPLAGLNDVSDHHLVYVDVVKPVPVPAALPLFASAMAVFGWVARRKVK